VLVAEGTYRENALLFAGAQLFGGYSVDFRKRDPLLHRSVLVGQAPSPMASGAIAAVHAEGLSGSTPETVVSGFVIRGYDVPGAADFATDMILHGLKGLPGSKA